MGKATRWLRSLLGGKKESGCVRQYQSSRSFNGGGREGGVLKDKTRWSFAKSRRDSGEAAEQPGSATGWLKSLFVEHHEKEHKNHCHAAVAEGKAAPTATVAPAQAAVELVKPTSYEKNRALLNVGLQERLAAVNIQAVFRGYLARKALRALKALVKLQALARGYLVRKHAAATLHRMQVLMRAQAGVLDRKARTRHSNSIGPRERFVEAIRNERRSSFKFNSRRLSSPMEYSSKAFGDDAKVVEIDPGRPKSRNRKISPISSDSSSMDRSCPLPSCNTTVGETDYYWAFPADECRASTTHSTPRCVNPGLLHHPNYMADTQSFKNKVRSQSAPKQRPEPAAGQKKKVDSGGLALAYRASLSGALMQRACSLAQQIVDSKSGGDRKLCQLSGEIRRDYCQFNRRR